MVTSLGCSLVPRHPREKLREGRLVTMVDFLVTGSHYLAQKPCWPICNKCYIIRLPVIANYGLEQDVQRQRFAVMGAFVELGCES